MTTPIGYLQFETSAGETATHAAIQADVAIVFAGWESRVLEVERLSVSAARVLCVSWREAETATWHKDIFEKLRITASSWSKDVRTVALHMYAAPAEGLEILLEFLVDLYEVTRRPLRVFFDISNCPEFFSIGLFAAATRLGLVITWTFFYAEARYDAADGDTKFTRGDWNVVPVPYLQTPIDPERPTCLVLGLGFEGEKARQLAVRYEPDCLYLLLPSPGFTDEYTKRAEVENAELLTMVRERDPDQPDRLLEAAAGDAAAVVASISSAVPNDSSANYLFIPTGPKPHALAMAAVVLGHPSATLLYRNPEKFEIRDSLNTGLSWITAVVDRSLPRIE